MREEPDTEPEEPSSLESPGESEESEGGMITKIESPITTTNPYRPEEELGGRCEGKNKPEPNTPGMRLAGLM